MFKLSQKARLLCGTGMWLFAGTKVLLIARAAWGENPEVGYALAWLVGAFIFFNFLIFPKAVPPNVSYVLEHPEPLPLHHCIRPRTWFVVAFMISLGIGLRAFSLVPSTFVAGFYLGLGISLLGCVRYYIRPLISLMKKTQDDDR